MSLPFCPFNVLGYAKAVDSIPIRIGDPSSGNMIFVTNLISIYVLQCCYSRRLGKISVNLILARFLIQCFSLKCFVCLFVLLQMFIRNYDEKTRAELTKKEPKDAKKDFAKSLLGGEYDEEESARSFQEALKEWRNQRCDNAIEPVTIWTQTEGSSIPVQVQFPERSLSYMDRLLLKRYRRYRFVHMQHLSIV
uniref:Uncharacterized protein n=1 Tax=Hippocampus comes TaxID=109280 RepID=A0A3Q2Y929_HIPCM